MLRVALKMLLGDRAKYLMLVCGLTFCTLLMGQQTAVFCGLMTWTVSTVRNIGAEIWVMDSMVEQANEIIPMRRIEVDRVRSVPGVEWAVPLFVGIEQARMENGSFLNVQLVGLDNGTLVGRPMEITAGRIEDLRLPDSVIVDQVAIEKFEKQGIPVRIGMTFEINDKVARVVAFSHSHRSFMGQPYIFTTFDRAMEYSRPQRKNLSFVLVQPSPDLPAEEVVRRINTLPGIQAQTRETLSWQTMIWYFKNTGIPVAFGTVIILGAVVGIVIAGQTFYLFVHDNLRYLAALKAMGATMRTLTHMVLLQAFFVGLIGYGIGMGLTAWFGVTVLERGEPPFYMPWHVPVFVGAVVITICIFSALIGLAKIAKLEPAVVFK